MSTRSPINDRYVEIEGASREALVRSIERGKVAERLLRDSNVTSYLDSMERQFVERLLKLPLSKREERDDLHVLAQAINKIRHQMKNDAALGKRAGDLLEQMYKGD